MTPLKIRLLGNLEVFAGEERLGRFPTQKSASLFAFLVLHRNRQHSREILANMCWADRPGTSARRCLRTELWRIRSVIEPDGTPSGHYLAVDKQEVQFDPAGKAWTDVGEFEAALGSLALGSSRQLAPAESRRLQEAVELYRGDFVDGCYDDWAIAPRERLRSQFLSAVGRLMEHHEAQGQWETAVAFGLQLVEHDPLLEHVHRALMRCYVRMGNRAAALRQYEACAQLLRRELDVEPMEETTALYEGIRSCPGDCGAFVQPSFGGDLRQQGRTREGKLLTTLFALKDRLEDVRARLERTIEEVSDLQDRQRG